jgi:hypothetical protein
MTWIKFICSARIGELEKIMADTKAGIQTWKEVM